VPGEIGLAVTAVHEANVHIMRGHEDQCDERRSSDV
jgi:hypothetical protein